MPKGFGGDWRELCVTTGLATAGALVVGTFCWIIGDLLWHGVQTFKISFLWLAPELAGRAGGIGPILISTVLILAICIAVALPIGMGTAILLAEFTPQENRFGQWVRRSLDILSGVPSIVFGLFGNALFCQWMGLGFSLLSGGLTLACMILPLLIRAVETGLRAVPSEVRLGAMALGVSTPTALWRLFLPLATPGLVVGLVLGIGRALAETAALIFTSGYVDRAPSSLLDSGRALSLHIYDLSMNVSGGDTNAYQSALVLVLLLFLINGLATLCTRRLLLGKVIAA